MRPCKACGYMVCRCTPIGDEVTPPLGLTPRYMWISERKSDIIRAMDRYSSAGKVIPREWIEELANL